MTDKELLEAAAKAAGHEVVFVNGLDDDGYDNGEWKYTWSVIDGLLNGWNPLQDDGDALRLAVKLALFADDDLISELKTIFVYPGDEYAATRRAIVLAAAAIGKEL